MVLACAAARSADAAEDTALAHGRELLRRAPLVDGHNDLPWAIRESPRAPGDLAAYDLLRRTPGQTDLARLRAGGVGAQFWSVYVPAENAARGFTRTQLEQIDLALRMIERYPDRLVLARTAADFERAARSGRIASLLAMEGGYAIENSLPVLRALCTLGVRSMTLTHNRTLDWADAAGDRARHHGLTRFGREVVREMNRLGMLVDLAHVSPEVMRDALEVAEAPVIFSHSGARALVDVPRNVPDAILGRLPQNGGVVMVVFYPGFVSRDYASWSRERDRRLAAVSGKAAKQRAAAVYDRAHPRPRATLAQVADHVEHVRKVAGPDHVGLGSDFDGMQGLAPAGLEDVSKYPALVAELVRRGWSDPDLEKLVRGNILRVLRRAEEVARELRAARPASTATIEDLDGPRAAGRR
jgi:membrane dipeptidase